MTYRATVLRVMIASPADVARERDIIERTIHDWNAVHSADRKIVLLPVRWETHASPSMADRAQATINRQLLEDCDLLVAAFWTRLGTPTGLSASGTAEEIEHHLAAKKPAMLYFSQAPVVPESLDHEQYAALRAFRKRSKSQGLISEYESPEALRSLFPTHLAHTILRDFQGEAGSSEDDASRLSGVTSRGQSSIELSKFAAHWLRLLATSQDGTLVATETFGGFSISIDETELISLASGRDEARARRTIRELADLGLIEDVGYQGEIFRLTDRGYQVADALPPASEPSAS